MVVPDAAPAVAPNPVHRRWAFPLAGLGFVALAVIVLATFFTASRFNQIKRPYARVPSDAEAVEPRISFDGGVTRYRAKGTVLFVTIRNPQLSLLSWFMFRHEREIAPLTYTDVYGDSTPAQQTVRGQRQMIGAQQAAEYAGLKKLGFDVSLEDGPVTIAYVSCVKASEDQRTCLQYVPAGDVLESDDQIVGIDGETVSTPAELRDTLATHKPGDVVKVDYDRAGVDGTQTGDVTLIADPDDSTKALMGIGLDDTRTISKLPFDITYSTEGIGGPSAGLAFTITLIDELTLGELTGGRTIAITGTIDVDGNVGAIGGLVQKASAVRQTGAKYFIVPKGQSDEEVAQARAATDNEVTIIQVGTLDEALEVLAELGGNADHLGQPGKDFKPAS